MITLDLAFQEATKNNRVCPQPQQWQILYDMLPGKIRMGSSWEPSPPLISAAWSDSPAMIKILRMRQHIEWAHKHVCLDQVYEFMTQLKENDWYHIGE